MTRRRTAAALLVLAALAATLLLLIRPPNPPAAAPRPAPPAAGRALAGPPPAESTAAGGADPAESAVLADSPLHLHLTTGGRPLAGVEVAFVRDRGFQISRFVAPNLVLLGEFEGDAPRLRIPAPRTEEMAELEWQALEAVARGRTDGAGALEVPGLADGRYEVWVRPVGPAKLREVRLLEVAGGRVSAPVLDVPARDLARVVCIDESGAPISGAWVLVTETTEDGEDVSETVADANGRFPRADLPFEARLRVEVACPRGAAAVRRIGAPVAWYEDARVEDVRATSEIVVRLARRATGVLRFEAEAAVDRVVVRSLAPEAAWYRFVSEQPVRKGEIVVPADEAHAELEILAPDCEPVVVRPVPGAALSVRLRRKAP